MESKGLLQSRRGEDGKQLLTMSSKKPATVKS